jgi:nicotinamide riboside transporter PnuC
MWERWKYQIKTGLPFGLILPIVITSFDWYGTSFSEAFWTKKFLFSLIVFLFSGIFIIGYFNWREKQKNEEYNKQK